MNSELGGGVIISSATDVSASIFRGAFVDDQRALSAQRMDAKVLSWFQFHIILQINQFFKMLLMYSTLFKSYYFPLTVFQSIISHLEPLNICICSGHFTFKSNLLLLRNTDIQDGLGDHSRRFCRINTCWSKCE